MIEGSNFSTLTDKHGEYGGQVEGDVYERSWKNKREDKPIEEDKPVQQNLDGINKIFHEEENPEERQRSMALNEQNEAIYRKERGHHAVKSKHGEYGNDPNHPYEWDKYSCKDEDQRPNVRAYGKYTKPEPNSEPKKSKR